MDIETAMLELYANRNGFRIEAVHPKFGGVTLYRNRKGIRLTPWENPIRHAIKLAPDIPPSKLGSEESS